MIGTSFEQGVDDRRAIEMNLTVIRLSHTHMSSLPCLGLR
jgi:hypothetical protein